MRLVSVSVEGVGKFRSPVHVSNMAPGVNVLMAENEAGKSTIFRAIRTCIFDRHSSTKKSIEELATKDAALPLAVTVEFEQGGHVYEIKKSFLRSTSARLSRDRIEIARGAQADEQVWELLGVAQGGGKSVDEAVFGILWVGQAQSFTLPEPSEAATSAMSAAIQAEVGTLVGGERARRALGSVKDELDALITAKEEKPKKGGDLFKAQQEEQRLSLALGEAEAALAELDDKIDLLGSKRAEKKRLSDPAEAQRISEELEKAKASLKSGEETRGRLKQYESEEQLALSLFNATKNTLLELEDRAARIDDRRTQSVLLEEVLSEAEAKEKSVSLRITSLIDDQRQASAKLIEIDTRAEALRKAESALAAQSFKDDLQKRLALFADLEQRLLANAAALAANKTTAKSIAALDEIEREAEKLTAALEAAAAQVSIEIVDESISAMLNGERINKLLAKPAIDLLTIEFAGIATVKISPPATRLAAAAVKRDELHQKLRQLFNACGVADAPALRASFTARQTLESQSKQLDAEKLGLGIKEPTIGLTIERTKSELAQLDDQLKNILASLEDVPTDSVNAELERLSQARSAIGEKRLEIEASLGAANEQSAKLAKDIGEKRGALQALSSQLKSDQAALPDDKRAVLLGGAKASCEEKQQSHRAKAAFLEEQRKLAPSADELDQLRNRVERYQSALANRREALARLDTLIANLEGRIQEAGGDGLGEKTAALREEAELAKRELQRQQTRKATLSLLRDVIEQSYSERREQLNAPLWRYLQPYLNDLFPRAEVLLGEGFAIEAITRHGPGSEHFERLSDGTQEQIAVLVRLAMGAMLADQGRKVPIILDDALVFSDDHRIEQMFDALKRAGNKQQVIVLTCRSKAFSLLGGRQLSIT